MAKTMNNLLRELNRISFSLTSGEIPIKCNGEELEVVPELKGENGDYWCELTLYQKKGGKE